MNLRNIKELVELSWTEQVPHGVCLNKPRSCESVLLKICKNISGQKEKTSSRCSASLILAKDEKIKVVSS